MLPRSSKESLKKIREKAYIVAESLSAAAMDYQSVDGGLNARKEFYVGESFTEVPGIGIARNINSGKVLTDTTLWKMVCEEGVVIDRHAHPNLEFVFVLAGGLDVYYDDEIVHVGQYQSHTINEEILHKVKFTERTVFIVGWYPEYIP